MKRQAVQLDLPAVQARAAELHAKQQVCYWVVLSYQDGLDMLAGTIPQAIRPQLLSNLKRGRAESSEAYAERIKEAV